MVFWAKKRTISKIKPNKSRYDLIFTTGGKLRSISADMITRLSLEVGDTIRIKLNEKKQLLWIKKDGIKVDTKW